MTYRIRRPNTGFTMIEIAIVLAIVGLILGAIWVAAKAVIDSNRANQAAQDIATITSNLRSTFIAQNSFSATGDQTSALVSEGIIPADLIPPAGASSPALDAWGQPVKIYFAGDGNARHFRVSFYGTPPDACFRIASQLANLGTSDAPIDLVTAAGGDTEAIANPTANPVVTNGKCSGLTTGLCSAALSSACALNPTTRTTAASTEFDFTIH